MFDLKWTVETVRKEWAVVKGAPGSFLLLVVICLTGSWLYWKGHYRDQLAEEASHTASWKDTSGMWESRANIYKDLVGQRPAETKATTTPVPARAPDPKPVLRPKIDRPASPSDSEAPEAKVTAPNGIAIGRDNNGTATVNNYETPKRTLSPSEAKRIGELTDVPAAGFIGVYSVMGDPESHQYAQQLWDLFKAKGWDVGLMVGQSMLERTPSGLFVAISPDDADNPPAGVAQVYGAFRSAGLDVHGMTVKGTQKGQWYIFVGAQPS